MLFNRAYLCVCRGSVASSQAPGHVTHFYVWTTLKIVSFPDANFFVTDGTAVVIVPT